jgi:hypothetical protein
MLELEATGAYTLIYKYFCLYPSFCYLLKQRASVKQREILHTYTNPLAKGSIYYKFAVRGAYRLSPGSLVALTKPTAMAIRNWHYLQQDRTVIV